MSNIQNQELFQISEIEINGTLTKTINARDLHSFLESKQDFSTWIKNRIEKYDFIKNQEFVRFHKKMEANNATMIEYIITLDMAKELSMVENNEQGRLARRYFIECEKKLKEIKQEPPKPVEPAPQAGSFKDKFDVIKALVDNTSLSSVAKETLLITSVEENLGLRIPYRPVIERKAYSAKEIGDKLGISANMVGRIANDHGLKTEEFGRRVLSKSMYGSYLEPDHMIDSSKQVEQFLYYDNVIPVIKNILEEN